MIAIDTQKSEVLLSNQINHILKDRHPYQSWLKKYSRKVPNFEANKEDPLKWKSNLLQTYKKTFGVSFEEEKEIIAPLADIGQEATGSMGDDTPMPVMSHQNRSIYDYFRQQFAQVTNPAIDSLRESSVMSLEVCIGEERNIFEESPKHADRLILNSPVLDRQTFEAIVNNDLKDYSNDRIDLNYDCTIDLEEAINTISDRAVRSVKKGNNLIILSDKQINKGKLVIPAPMALGAVHHKLISEGLRCDTNIIVETGSARNPHHFAVLIGYGATAIYPYLAFEIIRELSERKANLSSVYGGSVSNYVKGINKGLLKIMSKMGISCIPSYRGAQLFELVGLDSNIVDMCFKGTVSRIAGTDYEDIQNDLIENRESAWNLSEKIKTGGLLKYVHGDEYHDYNPDVVKLLQACVSSGEYSEYEKYASLTVSYTHLTLPTSQYV